MSDVVAYRPREIAAFSLYWHWTQKHWQMNVRRRSEPGWDISRISNEQAQAIFSVLETSGHPDGPWTVKQLEVWKSFDGPKIGEGVHAIPDDLFAPGLYDDSLKPTYDAPEDIADFTALIADWKLAIAENTEARHDVEG